MITFNCETQLKRRRTMSKQRDLNLLDYDISRNRYRELKYFCLQYDEKKQKLNQLCKMPLSEYPSKAVSSENINYKKKSLEKDIYIIEKAALMADSSLYEYLLKSVTNEVKYQYIDIPVSRAVFYRKKKKFFKILNYLKE